MVAATLGRMPYDEPYEMKQYGDLFRQALLQSGQSNSGLIGMEGLANMLSQRSLPIVFRSFRGSCRLAGNHGSLNRGAFVSSMLLRLALCIFSQILRRQKLLRLFPGNRVLSPAPRWRS